MNQSMSMVDNTDTRYLTSGHGLLRHLAFRRDLAKGLSGQNPAPFLLVGIPFLERNTAGTSDAGASIGHHTAEALGTHRCELYGGREVRFSF